MTAHPRLLDLLERGDLDWDNPRHREAYLKAWVNGDLPAGGEAPQDEEPEPAAEGGAR